ncbi:MAG TPA: DUF4476 domain-containing protein [Edaphocola sp.]|nr:DUF4476 domain-containing protein [Edaphocola sp.]
MKKLLFLSLILLFCASVGFAQSRRSTIRFSLSDGSRIAVAMNGRYFDKTGRGLTVGDVPGRKLDVKIYRYRPYARRSGGKATLVFSGKIKIEKGGTYDAVVDAQTGQLYLTEVNNLDNIVGKLPPPEANQPVDETPGITESAMPHVPAAGSSPALQQLKTKMYGQISDAKKLKTALHFLQKQNSLNAEDLRLICSWLLFDDNRLSFVRQAYDKVSDKENLGSVRSVFTETANQQAFDRMLKEKQP